MSEETKVFNALSENVRSQTHTARVQAYVRRIREEGFQAVKGDIPAELRAAVIAACRRADVSLTSKGERAEREEMARKQFVKRVKAAAAESAKRQEEARRNRPAGPAAGASVFGMPVVLSSPAAKGLWSMSVSIPRTAAVDEAQKRGVRFEVPPMSKDFPPDLRDMFRKETELSMALGAEAIKAIPDKVVSMKQSRYGSDSKTVTIEINGRKVVVKGTAEELPMNIVQTKAIYSLVDKYGKAPSSLSDGERKTMESLIHQAGTSDIGALKEKLNSGTLLNKVRKLKTPDIPEPLMSDFRNARAFRKEFPKTVESNKTALGIGGPENGQETFPSPRERKEMLKKSLTENPFDLRDVARREGMTLNGLTNEGRSTNVGHPLQKQNNTFRNMLMLGADAFGVDRDGRIPPKLVAWAEKNSGKAKEFLALRGKYKADLEGLRKALPPLEVPPASLEKRRMPEKLACAARPEYLSPVNTDAERLVSRLRENSDKLSDGKKKTPPRDRPAQKRPAAVRQTPQRTPADIARIKMLRDKMAAQH